MSQMFTLDEVAHILRLDEQMKDPVRWLKRQIARGRITAPKFGRSYLMTQAHIDAAVAALESGRRPITEPTPIGLSAASMRRRAS